MDKHRENDFYIVGKTFSGNTQSRSCPFAAENQDGLKNINEETWRSKKDKWFEQRKFRTLYFNVWILDDSDRG